MFLDQIEHICDRRIQMENLQTLDNSVLAEVVGGKIVAIPLWCVLQHEDW